MSALAPVPGDVPTVQRTASSYTDVADAVREAASQLRALAGDASIAASDAVAALAAQAGDTADRLDKLHERYRVAGSALTTYAGELDAVKTEADAAISRHGVAAQDLAEAERWVAHYRTERLVATDPTQADEAHARQRHWEGQRDEAHAIMQSAARDVEEAHARQDTAARTAKDAIDEAVDSDGLNDSWWDNVKGWVSENAEFLKSLKTALSWITTGLTFLTFVFPVLAPLTLLSAALTVGLSGLLAASGEISWAEFGLDALLLVTAGVGAVAGRVVSQTVTGLKGLRVARLSAQGGARSPIRQVTGSFNRLSIPTRTVPQKITQMLTNGRKFRGVANAHAHRIFTQAKVGAGPLDDFFIGHGMAAIRSARITAMIQGAARTTDSAAAYADLPAGLFDSLGLEPVAEGLRTVSEVRDNVHASTTMSIGASQ
ncbi:hypothetical protein [Demequina aestuarii]|uniref:hypothetical protein n=1 Tax=Demequina aestuarii TaxID=327095 RepID=UPI000785B986|nr:hypothetical protein [Demequina aestuarii]